MSYTTLSNYLSEDLKPCLFPSTAEGCIDAIVKKYKDKHDSHHGKLVKLVREIIETTPWV